MNHQTIQSSTQHAPSSNIAQLTLGGGCHWCTEAVFQSLQGVINVEQGWASSAPPYESWSEAVRISFDPNRISQVELVRVHLHTHSATKAHSLRGKYRSALYFHDDNQQKLLAEMLATLAGEFSQPLVTLILPLEGFKASPAGYQNYYQTDPDRPFCRVYIASKLEKLARLLEDDKAKPFGHDLKLPKA